MVYSALLYLCKNAPYKGSATDLADFSCCGKKMTTLRMLSSLEKKGLISRSTEGVSLAQNETAAAQNETATAQNETISKEKRTKKENIIKENEYNVFSYIGAKKEEKASPIDKVIFNLFHMQPLQISSITPLSRGAGDVPANTGYYRIITTEFGYLNPKTFVDEFYNYWSGKGWPEKGNKLYLMRSWMDLYKRKNPKHKPTLSENERIILKTFLDNIDQRLIVRLFDVVKRFEVTDRVIYFSVPKENVENFVIWLNSMPLRNIFAAYNRTVSVKPV